MRILWETRSGARVRAALAAAMALFIVAACGGNPSAGQATSSPAPSIPVAQKDQAIASRMPEAIRKKGTLVVVMSVTSPPLHYYSTDGKTIIGLDADLAKALGQVLGLQTQVQGVELQQLIPGMQAGRYDVAVSQMSPTKKRQEVLDFIDYFQSGTKLAVKKGNPQRIQLDNLDTFCGRRIAVETGSVQAQQYLPLLSQKCTAAGKQALSAVGMPDKQNAILAVVSGRADAVLTDSPAVDYAIKQSDQVEGAGKYSNGPVGIGVLKGSGLLDPVREALLALMKQGVYQKILARWGLQAGAVSDPIVNDPNG
jgi:polar amino acid transport system substrate-binding protein